MNENQNETKNKRKCNAITSMKRKNVTYNKINFLASSRSYLW